MEIELDYNELSEINDLIQKRMRYYEMLKDNSDSYEEYDYWKKEFERIAKTGRKIFDYYWTAKKELEGK